MKDIPVHQLNSRSSSGLEIRSLNRGGVPKDVETLGVHRDDHYLFFLLEEGSASMMIDFELVNFEHPSLFYILPGQVHHSISSRYDILNGWFLAVDTALVPADYRNVFENQLALQQPVLLTESLLKQCQNLLILLEQKYRDDDQSAFHLPVVHSLLQSFLGMVACVYNNLNNQQHQLSRPAQLSQQFKKLLLVDLRLVKSPSAYAAKLNVSESYLNESLKKTTGFSVSYWILQEVMLEAKRLLYYSQLNVKEIAHNLGYDDHAYFSRLFKKALNITPLAFREQYRK